MAFSPRLSATNPKQEENGEKIKIQLALIALFKFKSA